MKVSFIENYMQICIAELLIIIIFNINYNTLYLYLILIYY